MGKRRQYRDEELHAELDWEEEKNMAHIQASQDPHGFWCGACANWTTGALQLIDQKRLS